MIDAKQILILLILGLATNAHKILILFPTPSFSHQQPIMALTEALIQKGHQLFVVSPNVVPGLKNNSNYTFVDLSSSYDLYSGGVDNNTNEKATNFQRQISSSEFSEVWRKVSKIPSYQFKSKEFLHFQRRVKEERLEFDTVIVQTHFVPYMCGMTHLLAPGKPIVAISTLTPDFSIDEYIGGLPHPSFLPYSTPFTDRMSFWQKIINWYVRMTMYIPGSAIMHDSARTFFRENYGSELEGLVDGCRSNISLSIITANSLHYYPRLLSPNIVEVGPIHIREPQKLPQILQDWLAGAEKGVIYLSLGSNMRSKSLPTEARSNLLRVFKELPAGYRVLWKWESDEKIPGQSGNVLTQKWLPQQSILAHPKVKLFMTQGGLQSFQEALHYGVPLIGIPFYGDQPVNVAKMVDSGIGVKLEPQDLDSFEKIKTAIEKVLFDTSYAVNMKKLSAISRDFTAHSLDKAVFWVEHVAKHGGASHLRPSTANTTFFEYFCLDIISVIIVIVLVVLYTMVSVCKFLVNIFLRRNSKIKTK